MACADVRDGGTRLSALVRDFNDCGANPRALSEMDGVRLDCGATGNNRRAGATAENGTYPDWFGYLRERRGMHFL